jgi:hypothetical protein
MESCGDLVDRVLAGVVHLLLAPRNDTLLAEAARQVEQMLLRAVDPLHPCDM